MVVVGEAGENLLGAGVLGDSLGTLGDSVLGKLSGEEEPDSGLDLPRGDGGPLVVVCKTAGLGSNTLKQVVDKRVHDAHGLGGDTSVRVHLLQYLVDVDGKRLSPLGFPLFLVSLGDGLGGFSCSLPGGLWWHVVALWSSGEVTAAHMTQRHLCCFSVSPGDAMAGP